MKYHISPDGPKPCQATKRPCPVGGEHFTALRDAERAFEAAYGGAVPTGQKSVQLSKIEIYSPIVPFAGGRYFGCSVEKESLVPFLTAFRSQVGGEKAVRMEGFKAQRDRGYVYHMTAITPPEMKKVPKSVSPPAGPVAITYAGLGRAIDGDDEAWFVVCKAPAIQKWRADLGLPAKDLHVTIGFEPKDVHTKSKGEESIVIR